MTSSAPPAPAADGGGGPVRLRGLLAYQGTRYHGWARQPGLPTVEQEVLDALARVLGGWQGNLTCAGRTDAGVHAQGQVVHFDAPSQTDPERLLRGLNAVLPPDIRWLDLRAAPEQFDARFAALWRHYRYFATDTIPDPLQRHWVLSCRDRLDAASMDAAVAALVGEHDFRSFCKPRPGATAIREVLRCRWRREQGLVVLDCRADAFCHSMVRSVVGASLLVGSGRRPAQWLAELLHSPSRTAAAPVAPAHGLTLVAVGYPADAQLAARVFATRAQRGPHPFHER